MHWDIAKSVIPYALITYPLLTGAGFLTGTLLHFRGDKRKSLYCPMSFRKYGVLWAASCKRDI